MKKNKKLLYTIFVTILVLGIVLTPLVFGTDFLRHVNPEMVEEDEFSYTGLFSLFADSLDSLSGEDWSSAKSALESTDEVYIPPDLKPSLTGIKKTGIELVNNLENTQQGIKNAKIARMVENFEKGEKSLDNALLPLNKSRKNYDELKTSFETVAEQLNVDIPPQFVDEISKVDELMKNYSQQIENQREAIEQRKELKENEIKTPPTIKVTTPKNVFPGENFTITGSLTRANNPITNTIMKINWTEQETKTNTNEQGNFSQTLNTPPTLPKGKQTLKITTENQPETTSIKRTIKIIKIKPKITTTTPNLSFSGRKITIKGTIKAENEPLTDSEILIRIGEKTRKTKTNETGDFTLSPRIPITKLSGNYQPTIIVNPNNPKIDNARKTTEVLNLNPLTLTIATLAIITLIIIWWRRTEKPTKIEKQKPTKTPLKKPETQIQEEEEPGEIERLFLKALKTVAKFTGINIEETQTIREYLSRVKGRLGRAYEPFKRLSLKFEKHIYGKTKTTPEETKSLLEKIIAFLKRDKK